MADIEKNLIKAMVRGFSRSIILWLISHNSMSGYEMMKEIKRLTGEKLHPGVIYPILYELEYRKFIIGKWIKKGRRRIKYFSITNKGIKLLNEFKTFLKMPIKEVIMDLLSE